MRLSNENHVLVDRAFTRYHQECDSTKVHRLPGGSIRFYILKFMGWSQENIATELAKDKNEKEKSRNAPVPEPTEYCTQMVALAKKDKEEQDKQNEQRRQNVREWLEKKEEPMQEKKVQISDIERMENTKKLNEAGKAKRIKDLEDFWDTVPESQRAGFSKEDYVRMNS